MRHKCRAHSGVFFFMFRKVRDRRRQLVAIYQHQLQTFDGQLMPL